MGTEKRHYTKLLKLSLLASMVVFLGACQNNGDIVSTSVATVDEATSIPSTTPSSTSPLLPPTASTATVSPIDVDQTGHESCDSGEILFRATGDGIINASKTGLYLACSDGKQAVQVLAESSFLPIDEWEFMDLAVAPSGTTLALLALGPHSESAPTPSEIYFLDIATYSVTSSYSVPYTIYKISWSPDSEYLAYLATKSSSGYSVVIEILHIPTGTVSTIKSVEANPVANLAWSSDGKQLLYTEDSGDNPIILNGYLATIQCEVAAHRCELSGQILVDWLNNPSYMLSWIPGTSNVVAKYADSGNYYIEIRSSTGDLLETFNLNEQYPELTYGFSPPSASFDGGRIAFTAWSRKNDPIGVYILKRADGSLFNLFEALAMQDIRADQVIWLP